MKSFRLTLSLARNEDDFGRSDHQSIDLFVLLKYHLIVTKPCLQGLKPCCLTSGNPFLAVSRHCKTLVMPRQTETCAYRTLYLQAVLKYIDR